MLDDKKEEKPTIDIPERKFLREFVEKASHSDLKAVAAMVKNMNCYKHTEE